MTVVECQIPKNGRIHARKIIEEKRTKAVNRTGGCVLEVHFTRTAGVPDRIDKIIWEVKNETP